MDDPKKIDGQCPGTGKAGLLAWLKKVGVAIKHLPWAPPSTIQIGDGPKMKLAGLTYTGPEASMPPFLFVTKEEMSDAEAEKTVAEVKAKLEQQLGHPVSMMLVPLGQVELQPCNCKACRMRAAAPWN